MQTLEAIYDGAVFRPVRPVSIEPNTRVKIIIETELLTDKTVADVASHLFGVIDVAGPSDLSTNKQHLEGFGA